MGLKIIIGDTEGDLPIMHHPFNGLIPEVNKILAEGAKLEKLVIQSDDGDTIIPC
mgnify:CR=1 FL=1